MALPKPHRLRERKEFKRVYRRGKRCGGKALMLRVARQPKTIAAKPLTKSFGENHISSTPQTNNSATNSSASSQACIPQAGIPQASISQTSIPQSPAPQPSRIAVVVSTKVHKRAVVRNRLRRQIQAALQSLLPRLRPEQLIVITVKPPAVECDYYEFLQQLEQQLTQAEALHGH